MIEKDKQLIIRAINGDIESFNHLAKKYQGAIYGLTYHWIRNFADAEDITQETFIKAFENMSQLRDPESFSGWLRSIARNICRKRQRSSLNDLVSIDSPVHSTLRDQLKDSKQLPDQEIEKQQKQQAILKILDVLSPNIRLTITLFYIDDLNHKEISQFLEIPISTVKSRLHRARKILKEEALKMLEETLNAQKKPSLFVRKVCGYLHILEKGNGNLRKTPNSSASSDDLLVPKGDIWNLRLKQGDFIEARFYSQDKKAVEGFFRFDQVNKAAVILQCSFCSRREDEVEALVTGPGVHICETCIEACVDVLIKEKGYRIGFTHSDAKHKTPEAEEILN